MLERQRHRLLRLKQNKYAAELIQELYAMFGDTEPAQFPNGIELTQEDGEPPITVRNFSGLPLFEGAPPGSDDFGDIDFGDGGDATATVTQTGGDSIPGTVTSGTGSSYVVTLDTGPIVNVTQVPALIVGETIPAGSRVLVFLSNGVYRINVGCWL